VIVDDIVEFSITNLYYNSSNQII